VVLVLTTQQATSAYVAVGTQTLESSKFNQSGLGQCW